MLKAVSRGVVATLLIVLLSTFVLACGDSDDDAKQGSDQPGSSANADPDLKGEIALGLAVPTTGPLAPQGEDQVRGAELAAAKVNSEGGVLGKKLVVKVEDTQGQTPGSVQAVRKLVSVDRVPVVIGEYLSANTIAMGKYLNKNKVVHINPAGSSTDASDVGPFTVASIALDSITGEFAAQKLYDAGYRKIAFLGPNNTYGASFERLIKENFEALGGEVTESVLYTEGESTYRAELERLKDSDPELIVYGSYVPDTITINKEAFELGIEPSELFGIYCSLVIEEVPANAVAGQLGTDLAFAAEGSEGQRFLEAYEAEHGGDPRGPYASLVYDAVLMSAAAINEAGKDDPESIRDALLSTIQDFEGATGPISLDDNGQRVKQEYGLFVGNDEGKLDQVAELPGPEG